MIWAITQNDYLKIYKAIYKAVSTALSYAFSDISQGEPQLIANLVWHLPKSINQIKVSNGYSIKSYGVFVHARPLVKCVSFPCSNPTSVEIGDLLLLNTVVSKGIVLSKKALLLQAKKITSLPPEPDNCNQYHLYTHWPPFEYVRSTGSLNGKKRHIAGVDLNDAAKYFLILTVYDTCFYPAKVCLIPGVPHIWNCNLMTAKSKESGLGHYRCFLSDLVHFIVGNSGKEYVTPPPLKTRNWDRVIEDLTSCTAKLFSTFMNRASKGNSKKRGPLLSFCFLSEKMPVFSSLKIDKQFENIEANLKGPPDVPEEPIWELDNEGGISIIEFVIDKTESGNT